MGRKMASANFMKASHRPFGAMDLFNRDLVTHTFTSDMHFRSSFDKIECFRVIDEEGNVVTPGYADKIPVEKLMKIYDDMVTQNEIDKVFEQAQRMSQISFYMTQLGEEASGVGTAAALKDQDLIFPQYREAGVFLWRGFGVEQMAHQLTGNHKDFGQGKQMPIHYGSKEHNICTVSSPLCTQVPQASGSGYKYRINNEDRIAVTYFGEGAASEGDFHPALNFAATLRSQTLFYCRNNMYAISTPIDDQYAGDGIAVRGVAYGMPTIRVDGNDLFAIYCATEEARRLIIKDKMPVLIEAISYRQGNHSTSDQADRYRDEEAMKKWNDLIAQISSPIERLEKYMKNQGLYDEERTKKLRLDAKTAVRAALKAANGEKMPPID